MNLERRRALPPGANWVELPRADGAVLRAVYWLPERKNGRSLVFLNGRADFIEKYAESYWHWRARGLGLMTFDWRGQGLSGRFAQREENYFEKWLEDLGALSKIAEGWLGRNLVVAAHSMGGHLALRYLAERGADTVYSRAVILAPMVGISRWPDAILMRLAETACRLGRADKYAPGHTEYGARQRSPLRQKLLTGDAQRFSDEHWWIEQNPGLALGGVTYRWLYEALKSCAKLRSPGVPEAIKIPLLMIAGSTERLVDKDAAFDLSARIPGARRLEIADGAHELLRETPALQAELHAAVDAFLELGAQ